MKTNQAFAILSAAGGAHAARIITEHNGNMLRFAVWRAARKLRRGVPVAKIIHEKWFYGMPFYTNRYTLDPRPDTETLVESALCDNRGVGRLRVLDLGTGTGCIIISILANISGASGVAVDLSRRALRVARKNIAKHDMGNRLVVVRGSFANSKLVNEQFDVIVSNPPYIARHDMRVNAAAMFDPKMALYAEKDGLAAYMEIAQNAVNWIKSGGRIYLEIGAGMSRAVKSIFSRVGWKFVRADKDLSGKIRVLVFSL